MSALTIKVTLTIAVAVVAVLATAALLSLTNNSNSSNNSNSFAWTAQVLTGQGAVGESQGRSEGEGRDEGGSGGGSDVISSVDEIPVFEGARITNRTCVDDPTDKCWVELNTTASVDEVATFYRNLLTNAGWSILAEVHGKSKVVLSLSQGGSSETSGSLENSYSSDGSDAAPAALPPIRRYIDVSVSQDDYEGGTYVNLMYERWPDAREIPIYPDAEEVKVEWDVLDDFTQHRVTRFITTASPGEVEAYYKDVMTQLGWTYRDYKPVNNRDPHRSGIFFRYSRSIPGGMIGSGVTLFTDPLPENRTQVELIAEGDEIYELWKQQQQQAGSSSSSSSSSSLSPTP